METDKNMRVAAFRSFLEVKAGAQGAFLNMMVSLGKRGHKIDVFALNMSDEFKKALGSSNIGVTCLNFRELKFRFINPWLRIVNEFRAALLYRGLAQKINKEYDIVFVDHLDYSPLVLLVVKIPKIYYCYEPPRPYYEPRLNNGRRISRMLTVVPFLVDKLLDKYCAQHADLILSNSDYSREYTWRSYGIFPVTNCLGVDLQKYRKLPLTKENLVLSVGVIHPLKAHDFVIRSLGLVPADKRPKLVVIAYRAHEREKQRLFDLAATSGVDLEIKDYISHDEFLELHNRAKVVAVAYVMEPSVEPVALACETPIVAVREGGARETIVHGETGLLVGRDEAEFAKAIESLLDNPKKAAEMGRKGREWIEKNFTWEKCAEDLEKNLRRALNRR